MVDSKIDVEVPRGPVKVPGTSDWVHGASQGAPSVGISRKQEREAS